MKRAPLLLGLLLAACSSSPDPKDLRRDSDPTIEQREREIDAAEQKRRDFRTVLLRLDQAMDSYVRALAAKGEPRADAQAERLERTIRSMVLDQGPSMVGPAAKGRSTSDPGENYGLLQAAAIDASVPADQGIALAALGFSGAHSVMPTLLSGAQSGDPFLVDRAVLGLAVLKAPDTPPGVLARIVENDKHPEDGRVQAAWALYQLQGAVSDQEPILAIWRRFLTDGRDKLPAGVQVSAIRGLGFARDAKDAPLAAEFLRSPVPRLRMTACIALARMNAQQFANELIELIGPRETVQNVRLHARKALSDLAGGQDFGYDLSAWRKAFDRSLGEPIR
jgi:HEAT repeat protein